MPFSYIEILIYCNKHSPVSFSTIRDEFKMTKNEVYSITTELKNLGYIYYVGDSSFSTTYKGRTIIKNMIFDWIFKNLLPVVAIVISIIALFK